MPESVSRRRGIPELLQGCGAALPHATRCDFADGDLGVPPFDRTGGKASLIRQGSILLTFANELAAVVSQAEQELGCKDDRVSGELSPGVSTTIGQYVLARLWPNIECELHRGNTSRIVGLLLVGKVLVGLIEGPARDRGVRSEPFTEDELLLIAPLDTSSDKLSGDHAAELQRAPAPSTAKSGLAQTVVDAVRQLRTGTRDL